jgi:hypothetical protein
MLIRAFAGAVLDRMALAGVRQEAERALNGGLERILRAA